MRPHLPPIRLEAESQREHQDLDLTSVRRASLRIEFEDGHHAHLGLAISVPTSLDSRLQPPSAHLEACARLRGAGLLDAGDHVLWPVGCGTPCLPPWQPELAGWGRRCSGVLTVTWIVG